VQKTVLLGVALVAILAQSAGAQTASIKDVAWLQGFPQRVGYRSTGPGQMLAWVEGTSSGRTRRIESHTEP